MLIPTTQDGVRSGFRWMVMVVQSSRHHAHSARSSFLAQRFCRDGRRNRNRVRLKSMGTNDALLDDKTERIYGKLRAIGQKQARLEVVSVDVFPYCEKQPSVAFPEVKIAAVQQAQGLTTILQHPWFLLGTRNVNPQLDSHWRQLFRQTAPKAENSNTNCFNSTFGKTGDGRTVTVIDSSDECVVLAAQNLGK
jgi:hypothetical protein